jgi:hypothetical protein
VEITIGAHIPHSLVNALSLSKIVTWMHNALRVGKNQIVFKSIALQGF